MLCNFCKPVLFFLSFFFGLNGKENNIWGTYQIVDSEWGGHRLTLRKNQQFVQVMSGCVYNIQTTGKWETAGDTLILKPFVQKDLRSGVRSGDNLTISRFIIKVDTLFQINEEDGIAIYDSDLALVRKTQ